MGKVIHRAAGRGVEDKRWIKCFHTFSYGSFYDPRRINFGSLRVLSDNILEGGEGFGSHTHENMELVTIVFKGAMEQGDHNGNISVLNAGEVLVLSAGTRTLHNEYNQSQTEPIEFMRIWIYPRWNDTEPRVSSARIPEFVPDELTMIVAPYGDLCEICAINPEKLGKEHPEHTAHISQCAWIYMAEMSDNGVITHNIHKGDYGAYLFVLEGEVSVGETSLEKWDGYGVWHVDSITIESNKPSKILLLEVPNKR